MMKKLNIFYSREFYNLYSKYAVMDPDRVKLGDIIDYNTFDVIGSLSDFGINFTENVKCEINDAEPIYMSQNIKIGDISAGQNDIAKVSLRFGSDNSLYLATKGSKIVGIAEDNLGRNNLGQQIVALYNQDRWKRNWIVVTEVEYAKKAIIILSNGKNAEIELKARISNPTGFGEFMNAELSFGSESSIGFRYIMPEDDYRSILFKAKEINRSLFVFGNPRFNTRDFTPPETMSPGFNIENEPDYLKDFVWE